MSNIDKVNEFFCGDKRLKKGLYRNLLDFSHLPYTGWSFFRASQNVGSVGIASGAIAFFFDVGTKILLSPVLFPATVITASLALIGAIVGALAHLIALCVAGLMDVSQKQSNKVAMA